MLTKITFVLRLVVSIILLQSLLFKFSGHPEAVHIFSTLGVEPWGRLGLGCIELIIGIAHGLGNARKLLEEIRDNYNKEIAKYF